MQWRLASAPLPSQKISELVYDVFRITLHIAESLWLPAMSWGKKKRECHDYLQDCFSCGRLCSGLPQLITDSWAAILAK